ncbi:ABC transporter permease [Brachybacterium sp. ACRRE]|uniref:ABC transporter permease n=1 Tax=Brachybacterium sp. ACRRE TaxID=2918184 RepID=UPI001EF3B76D|nr:hypothetical protein [Brachybacterium sp. ACRRE]MCG7308897.1 hypothetical protein [Brachybacterium sp. ACRRE]
MRPRTPAALEGTGRIARHILRRDRLRMAVWVLSISAFLLYFSAVLRSVFDPASLSARAAVMRTPSGIVMGGPGYGLDHYTPMVAVANEGTGWLIVALAVMSILHMVRHTRGEEDAGRAELIEAGPVGRRAPAAAALLTLLGLLAIIAVVGAATTLVAGSDASFVNGLALTAGSALAAFVFGCAALLTSEICASGRSATGLALVVLGAALVVRAAGDLIRLGGSVLSWFSPIAWAQQTRAFVDLRWWPLMLPVAACAALLVLTVLVAAHRDMGRGVLADRVGRARAGSMLRGPLGLALRQQRGALIACGAGLGLLWFGTGTMMSTLSASGRDLVSRTPALTQMLGADAADFAPRFLQVMMLFVALCAAAYGIVAVRQLARAEEESGRLELVLAAPSGRMRWWGAQLVVALGGTAALLAVSVAGFGGGALLVGVDDPDAGQYLLALLAHLPSTLVFGALAGALFGWWPRMAGLAWLLVAAACAISLFGAVLDLPAGLLGVSPFHWVPEAFSDTGDGSGTTPSAGGIGSSGPIRVAVVDVVLVLLALSGFRRRAVRAGE